MSALEKDPLLELLPPPHDWWALAACRNVDPDLWFPTRGGPTNQAKAVCWGECTVREQCLEYAMDNAEKFGIWGGTSERERRRMRRQRAREARAARGVPVEAPKPRRSRESPQRRYPLTDEQMETIRQRWADRALIRVSQQQIANDYGVSQQVISNIVNGRRGPSPLP